MSDKIRDAAQALLDNIYSPNFVAGAYPAAIEALRAALSAPQPTADERVAEHMRLVAAYGAQVQRDAFSGESLKLKIDAQEPDYSRLLAVDQSARSLLSASQEDAVVTSAMVGAYLKANDAYWAEVDAMPSDPTKPWRQGTPREATRIGLEAALAAMKETK